MYIIKNISPEKFSGFYYLIYNYINFNSKDLIEREKRLQGEKNNINNNLVLY